MQEVYYNQTRSEYYRQLNEASRSGGEVWPFISYALEGFLRGLKEQIEMIQTQELGVAWRDYVHSIFAFKNSKGDERRRHLILDLSSQSTPVFYENLRDISPRVAVNYANKSDITLTRDLRELQKLDLIEKTSEGYRARREIMLAFLPERRS